MRRPRADTGKALNHAPDSLVDTARRRARSSSFSASSKRHLAMEVILGVSHDFCLQAASPSGGGQQCPADQCALASSRKGAGVVLRGAGRISSTSAAEEDVEAR